MVSPDSHAPASSDGDAFDMRGKPRPFAVALAVIACSLMAISEATDYHFGLVAVALLLLTASLAAWLLTPRIPLAARITLVLAFAGASTLGLVHQVPGALMLPALSVGLTTTLAGPAGGAGLSALTTVALLLPRATALAYGDALGRLLALGSVWGTFALLYGNQRRLIQLQGWVQEYLDQSQELVEEARSRRQEASEALARIKHLNRQLALVNERSALLRQSAEAAEKAKAAFVARVSHELRTPLNMIIGLVGLIVEHPDPYGVLLPDELHEDLRIVHRNSEHLLSMINDVLDLSQVEAGRVSLHRERTDLAEIIGEALEAVSPLLERKRLALQIETPEDLPLISCDRIRIRQVLLNLVSNAVRFTHRGGISIAVSANRSTVRVSVADTGPGIEPDLAERIFDPFSHSQDQVHEPGTSSGLGLSISQQFIRLHGGRIWLETEPGAGSTFFFELPIDGPDERPISPAARVRSDWVWRESAFRTDGANLLDAPLPLRVIVCDPNGDLCPDLRRQSHGIDIVQTRRMAEALEEAKRCPPHLLLVNEYDEHQSPRQHQALLDRSVRDLPVMTCAVPPRLKQALDAGASGYLVKPITRDDLRRVLTSLPAPPRRVLVVDDKPSVTRLLHRMLMAIDAELDVISALDGPAALDAMRNQRPDLVLLDLLLPAMDGWEILDRKQRDRKISAIPVFIVSAHDPADQPRRSRRACLSVNGGLSLEAILRLGLSFSQLLLEQTQASTGTPDPAPG